MSAAAARGASPCTPILLLHRRRRRGGRDWPRVRAVTPDYPSVATGRHEAFLWRLAIVAAVAGLGTAWYLGLPWYVTREAIAHGESTSIETGVRDRIFYRSAWSAPHVENITVRVSRSERAVVRSPRCQRGGPTNSCCGSIR